jgi:hypothetical protein
LNMRKLSARQLTKNEIVWGVQRTICSCFSGIHRTLGVVSSLWTKHGYTTTLLRPRNSQNNVFLVGNLHRRRLRQGAHWDAGNAGQHSSTSASACATQCSGHHSLLTQSIHGRVAQVSVTHTFEYANVRASWEVGQGNTAMSSAIAHFARLQETTTECALTLCHAVFPVLRLPALRPPESQCASCLRSFLHMKWLAGRRFYSNEEVTA